MSKESVAASPEIEETEDFFTPEAFTFTEVLSERGYPSDEVTVCLDEEAAYFHKKALTKYRALPAGDTEGVESLAILLEEYEARMDANIYTFHIRGVSDDTVTDLSAIADAEFESKKRPRKSASGRLERILPPSENAAYLEYFNALSLSVHIEQIVSPDGRVMTAPPVEEIALFLAKAPTSQKMKLQMAIQELRADSAAFESRVSADFLAKR